MLKKIYSKFKSFFRLFFVIKSNEAKAIIIVKTKDSRYKKYWENFVYDIERYMMFSTTKYRADSFENLISRITAHYHVIEKGLAFQETRIGYGKNIIDSLFKHIDEYLEKQYPTNNEQFISSLHTLDAYCRFNLENGYDIKEILNKLEKYRKYLPNIDNNDCAGGTIEINRDDILEKINKDFKHLAYSRYSIRNFTEKEVDISLLIEAITIAQKSPSVCNRQSTRIYILTGEQYKEKALSCQNGNRGFGHLADKILIVTSNLRSFYSVDERNQSFIDGGMYGMSLIYALHSFGLGTCTLNWSASKERDLNLRSLIPISEEETVIFMIAVGHMPENFRVAHSQRKKTEDIVKILSDKDSISPVNEMVFSK